MAGSSLLAKVFHAVSSCSSDFIVSPWRNRLQRIVIVQFKHYHYDAHDSYDSDHPDNSHDYGQRRSYGL